MTQPPQLDSADTTASPPQDTRRSGAEADRTAWRRPPGVSTGTWRYAHEGTIASRYDDFVATTPLCQVDLAMVAETFGGRLPGPEGVEPDQTERARGQPDAGQRAAENSREKKWILDLGCGTGRASELLCQAGYGVFAIDLSTPMLREVIQRKNDGIIALRANLVQLDCFDDASAAGAVCLFSTLGMIQGRTNRRQFLTHVRRIVEPGGSFLLHVHNRYAAITHSAGRRQLIGSRMRSWWHRGVEFGDAVYPYRGLPDMFLHQFSRRELMQDLMSAGWNVQRWERLSLDGSRLMKERRIAGGFLVVVS